jgi:hypothetical protein
MKIEPFLFMKLLKRIGKDWVGKMMTKLCRPQQSLWWHNIHKGLTKLLKRVDRHIKILEKFWQKILQKSAKPILLAKVHKALEGFQKV